MTECCRKCLKMLCKKRDTVEDCPDCISEVYWHLQQIDKKLGDKK